MNDTFNRNTQDKSECTESKMSTMTFLFALHTWPLQGKGSNHLFKQLGYKSANNDMNYCTESVFKK